MKYSYLSFIISILLGGVITGNILGDMKNKSAELVFFVWKGIQVFRKRVIPSNPKTVKQQAQRTRFATMENIGLSCLASILNVYWKRFAIKKSEINAFMSRNLKGVKTVLVPANLVLIDGQYPTPVLESTTISVDAITIAPIGTGVIDPLIITVAKAAFVNYAKGVVAISAGAPISLTNPITFANPATTDDWLDEDTCVVVWFEADTIVDGHSFTNGTTFSV